jgi:hypothetical protein
MYNLTADRAETTDLWLTQRDDAKAMLARFLAWQVSRAFSFSNFPFVCLSQACLGNSSHLF